MKNIFFLFLLSLIFNLTYSQNIWTQLGDDINGEDSLDKSGISISLSSNGLIVAIGACNNDGNGTDAGHVRVYENILGIWIKIGDDIDGEAANDNFGQSVSLNSDGSIIAIGAGQNDGNGANAGHVRVYQNISGTWIKLGDDIEGEESNDFSGESVSLNSDGSVVAIGAKFNDGNGQNAGHVRVYKYQLGAWIQMGNDIDGEAAEDYSGQSISLNSDGSIIAIGAEHNNGNGPTSGHVRVYEYNSGSWIQLGSDINGEAPYDGSGHSLSLNSDGLVVAIGACSNDGNGLNSGHVRVYQNISGAWIQMGDDIDGEPGDISGTSVCLNSDGSVVAIGAWANDGNGFNAGHVRVYENTSGYWIQTGQDIEGEAPNDLSGISVSLNSDGFVVAIGAYLNDGNGTNSGHARIYNSCRTKDSISVSTCSNYTSPSGNYTWTSSGIYQDIIPNSAGCDSIITINLNIKNTNATINPIFCDSIPYVYTSPSGNNIWTSSGTFQDTIPNSVGCDSIITINLNINNTHATINPAFCNNTGYVYSSPSGTYTWSTSGTYIDTIPNFLGCDSIITINLTILDSLEITYTNNICANASPITLIGTPAGGVFSGPGINTNQFNPVAAGGAGNHTITYTLGGCSVDTVINVLEVPTSFFTVQPICEDDTSNIIYVGNANSMATYLWNFACGSIISGSGQGPYEVYFPIGSAVNSPYILSLTVIDTAGCTSSYYSDIYIFPTNSPNCCEMPLTNAGTDTLVCGNNYNFQAITSVGLGTWTLISGPGTSIIDDIHSPWSNVSVTDYGIYLFSWEEYNGYSFCSSTDVVEITFVENPIANIICDTIACDPILLIADTNILPCLYLWSTGDTTQSISVTTDNIYSLTVTENHGCQGIDSVHVIFSLSYSFTEFSNICEGDSLLWHGIYYNTPGIYYANYNTIKGCDSIFSIDLTVNNNTDSVINLTFCDSYTSPSGNYLWTNSGVYIDTVSNTSGCDSVITINLTILASPYINLGNDIVISESQTVIIGSGYNLPNYLWNTGDTVPVIVVEGAMGIGTYYYWLYSEGANGCSETDTIIITVTNSINMNEINDECDVFIFPNPTTGLFEVAMKNIEKIEIYNSLSQVILATNENIIDIKNLLSGAYIIVIFTENKTYTRKLIKE